MINEFNKTTKKKLENVELLKNAQIEDVDNNSSSTSLSPSKLKDKTVYVVSGFMRTGTSMMMRALESGGMQAEYQQSREEMRKRFADDHYDPNFGGLYELERQDYRNFDFPEDYKGKLIKALSGGAVRMKPMKDGIRVVFMRRDEEEIRQSYLAFFNQNINLNDNFQLRMGRFIETLDNRRDVKSLDVFWYRNVIEEPKKHFEILKSNGWPIDIDKAVSVVNPDYCRYRKEDLIEGIV